MPERQFFEVLAALVPEPFRAATLAALVALLRIVYDGKEPRWFRRLLEAVLCGCIALGVAYLCEALGLRQGWATFLGASIGLLGADQVREWGRRIADQKLR